MIRDIATEIIDLIRDGRGLEKELVNKPNIEIQKIIEIILKMLNNLFYKDIIVNLNNIISLIII